MFVADVPGAPEFFKGKVPVEPGMGWYLKYLYDQGILGSGRKIDSYPLHMDQYDTLSFREAFLDCIARRIGIGDALAEGLLEAAEKWGRRGRLEQRRPSLAGMGCRLSLDVARSRVVL